MFMVAGCAPPPPAGALVLHWGGEAGDVVADPDGGACGQGGQH